jgi:DNA-binding protein H-NS
MVQTYAYKDKWHMDINIENLELKELKILRKKVSAAIESFDQRKKDHALVALSEVAKQHGFKLDELMDAGSGKKSKPKALPKYAHPESLETTWTGKGRKPNWILEHIDAGKSLDELLIK